MDTLLPEQIEVLLEGRRKISVVLATNTICHMQSYDSLEIDLRWEIYHNTPSLEMMGDSQCLRRILHEIIT